jgi:hypothetical protein
MKDFVFHEEALALKELGFEFDKDSVFVFGYWNLIEYDIEWTFDTRVNMDSVNYIEAPLYSQAFRFFREKHNLYGFVTSATHPDRNLRFSFHIVDNWDVNEIFDTPEEAEIGCIKKLIELVKNKQNAQ